MKMFEIFIRKVSLRAGLHKDEVGMEFRMKVLFDFSNTKTMKGHEKKLFPISENLLDLRLSACYWDIEPSDFCILTSVS